MVNTDRLRNAYRAAAEQLEARTRQSSVAGSCQQSMSSASDHVNISTHSQTGTSVPAPVPVPATVGEASAVPAAATAAGPAARPAPVVRQAPASTVRSAPASGEWPAPDLVARPAATASAPAAQSAQVKAARPAELVSPGRSATASASRPTPVPALKPTAKPTASPVPAARPAAAPAPVVRPATASAAPVSPVRSAAGSTSKPAAATEVKPAVKPIAKPESTKPAAPATQNQSQQQKNDDQKEKELDAEKILKAGKCSFADLLTESIQNLDRVPNPLKRTAVSYVDEDYNTHHLTIGELWKGSKAVHEQLRYLVPETLKGGGALIEKVNTDKEGQPESFRLKPILILYGECSQFTPVFMGAASMLGMAFYSVERGEQLKEALQVLPPKTVFALIAHSFRLEELMAVLRSVGQAVRKRPRQLDLNPVYHLVILKQEREVVEEEEVKGVGDSGQAHKPLPIAYLINTSGTTRSLAAATATTDTPSSVSTKYVFVPAPAIVSNILDFKERFHLTWKDVVLISSPFTFDPALVDAFTGLYVFAHVILVCNSFRSSPDRLRAVIKQFGVTYATLTPSLWRKMTAGCTDQVVRELLATFRQINFGGELSPSLSELEAIVRLKPALEVYNLYGVTEVSPWASVFPYKSANAGCWADYGARFREKCKQRHGYCSEFLPVYGWLKNDQEKRCHMVLKTELSLNEKDDEICINSPFRRCLIFTPPNLWTYRSCHRTGDRARHVKDEETGEFVLFYDGRIAAHDGHGDLMVKVNGVKCWPNAIADYIRECFSQPVAYRALFEPDSDDPVPPRLFSVVHCLVAVGSWGAWPNALVDLVLVVEKRMAAVSADVGRKSTGGVSIACCKTDKWETEAAGDILRVVRRRFPSFAYRLFLLDESTVGSATVLTAHGKLDTARLRALAQRRSANELSCLLSPTNMTLEERNREKMQLEKTICSIFNQLVASAIGKRHSELVLMDLRDLNALGVSSIGRLQLAVQIEEAFAGRFPALDDQAKQVLFNIVNGCSVKQIVQHLIAVFVGMFDEEGKAEQQLIISSNEPKAELARIENSKTNQESLVEVSQLSHRVKVFESEQHLEEQSIVEPYCLTPLWSYFLEECVDSTPLIVIFQGVTYLITASHSGMVAALDAYSDEEQQTYKVFWTKKLSSRIDSSPAASTDGRLIFLCPHSDHFIALSTATGDIAWSYQVDTKMKNMPTVVGDRVISGNYNGTLYCWTAASGRMQWSIRLKQGGVVASPVVYGENRARLLVATLSGHLVALALDTGRQLWQQGFNFPDFYISQNIFATPLVMGDRAIVCFVRAYIVCLVLGEDDSPDKPRMLWGKVSPLEGRSRNSCGGDHFCAPVGVQLADGRQAVIVATHRLAVLCLELEKGDELWRADVAATINSVPFLVGNGVIVVDTEGNLQLLDTLTGKAFSARVNGGGTRKVSRCTSLKLVNFAKWNGPQGHSTQANQLPTSLVHSSPIVHRDKLFIGARDNFLHCFHLNLKLKGSSDASSSAN